MGFKSKKRKRPSTEFTHQSYNFNQQEAIEIDTIANNLFKKSFSISNNENYILPEPQTLFSEDFWEIEDLQKLKKELNETKSKLNNYNYEDWHQHTSQRNKAKDVEWRLRRDFDPEFVTQAWCKFHEIISKYPLIPTKAIYANHNKLSSLHLCEAPGAFITCLNHWLKINTPTIIWDWLAMTYNPYYEGNTNTSMISDDRFIMHTLKKWFFADDNSGDLMRLENLDSLIKKCKEKGKINLVTADGSINCNHDPGEQEKIVSSLHFCEVVAAIQILETGGNFLLKIFTTFEHETVCLIYLLTCIFKQIHFYKPVTSREGNSEVYIVCLEFKGLEFLVPYIPVLRNQYNQHLTKVMFRKKDIPQSFIKEIISCAEFFKNCQCEVIENNISAYDSKGLNSLNFKEKKIAKLVADKFISNFPLTKLHADLQIVGNSQLKKNKTNWISPSLEESFNEVKKKQELRPIDHLLMFRNQYFSQSVEPFIKQLLFQPADSDPDLYITIGKPYRWVQSSRFCSKQISEVYNLLFQAFNMEGNLQFSLPDRNSIKKFENESFIENQSVKTLYFCYTETCNNNHTIARIKQTLLNFVKGEDLILFGYLLLSQLNVGLIYLLSCTFEKVEFTINDKIGCYISLKNFIGKESILNKLEIVYKTAENAASKNFTILSVIAVTDLYESKLYSMIEKLNNWIAKFCINYIALVYENYDKKVSKQ